MNIGRELQQIDKVGADAWCLIQAGEFRAARRQLNKIKKSLCVFERERVVTIIEAKILQAKGDLKAARQKILANTCYIWSCLEAFEIIAASNPPADERSCMFFIEILGGCARLGPLADFGDDDISAFDVIANDSAEAWSYIKEVANFANPRTRSVITCRNEPFDRNAFLHCGVIRAYPLRKIERLAVISPPIPRRCGAY